MFLSTNNGTNWNTVNNGLTNTSIQALAVSGTNVFTGTYNGGIFLTTDNGTSWTAVSTGLTNTNVFAIAVSGTNLFAGTRLGMFLSTNNGTSWSDVSTGLTNNYIQSLTVFGSNLFAGTWGSGVWKRPISEMITSVKIISGEIPNSFNLRQNFPNPFNPSTSIKYDLPKNSFVKLIVFDELGREVKTLVNENQTAGTYEITFNGLLLPSGVYMYRLTTESFTQTKKMLLIK
jgi:hypothetical protein